MPTRPRHAQVPKRLLDMRHVYNEPEPAEGSDAAKAETHGVKILRKLLNESTQKFMQMWRDEEDSFKASRGKKKAKKRDVGTEKCLALAEQLLADIRREREAKDGA